jgi:hypothetical protein
MSAPRRYRLALLAYPGAYRAARAPELLATLAEGDDERGHASMREAAALVRCGFATRALTHGPADWPLAAAAALALTALLGGFTWAQRRFVPRDDVTVFMSDGPGTWLALALGLGAYVALAALLPSRARPPL